MDDGAMHRDVSPGKHSAARKAANAFVLSYTSEVHNMFLINPLRPR